MQEFSSSYGSTSNNSSSTSSSSVQSLAPNTQAGNYILRLSDNGRPVEMNSASANTLTVPNDGTVNFPIGAYIPAIIQLGTGQTSIAAASGVTLLSKGGNLKLMSQYSAATLYKRAVNAWVLIGDLSP